MTEKLRAFATIRLPDGTLENVELPVSEAGTPLVGEISEFMVLDRAVDLSHPDVRYLVDKLTAAEARIVELERRVRR